MKVHQTDFSKGSVYKNILEVAVPLTIAQLLNLLYNIVDRIYIGRIPHAGTLALTGIGLCFPLITLINAFTMLFGSGAGPLFAMARGNKNEREAQRIMGNTFTMLVCTGCILMIIGFLFYKPILYVFGASDITFPYAKAYITIYLFGTLSVMIALGMNPFINSQGFGNIGMFTVLIGAVCNIILDPIFIFVFHMGVRGAALATILSQFLSSAWVLYFLTKKAPIRLLKEALAVRWKRIKSITALGISGFIMAFTNSIVQIACNATLQQYGGDLYVGIMTVLNSVREICTMPVMGLANGAAPVMSFNYGEKAYDRVKKAIRFISIIGVCYTVVIWGFLKLAPGFFIRIFNNDPMLIKKGIPALHIYFFGFCFMALQFSGQNVFTALGKAKKATFFSLFRKVIIVTPLTLLLPSVAGLGVDGVFWAEPISNFVGGCACFFTMILTVMPESNQKMQKKKE